MILLNLTQSVPHTYRAESEKDDYEEKMIRCTAYWSTPRVLIFWIFTRFTKMQFLTSEPNFTNAKSEREVRFGKTTFENDLNGDYMSRKRFHFYLFSKQFENIKWWNRKIEFPLFLSPETLLENVSPF